MQIAEKLLLQLPGQIHRSGKAMNRSAHISITFVNTGLFNLIGIFLHITDELFGKLLVIAMMTFDDD